MKNIPVLILAWRRVDRAREMVQVLRRLDIKRVYISIDGQRKGEFNPNIDRVYEIFSEMENWSNEILIRRRTESTGLYDAVTSGIDWFFSNEERGVILEDDVIPTEEFFILSKYFFDRGYDKMMPTFSGDARYTKKMHILTNSQLIKGNLFSCWGWGTWSYFWKDFRSSKVSSRDMVTPESWNVTTIYRLSYKLFCNQNKANYCRLSQSWAYQVFLYCLINNYLQLYPTRNLVSNKGGDEWASNTITFQKESLLMVQEGWELEDDCEIKGATKKVDSFNILQYHCSRKNLLVLASISILNILIVGDKYNHLKE